MHIFVITKVKKVGEHSRIICANGGGDHAYECAMAWAVGHRV